MPLLSFIAVAADARRQLGANDLKRISMAEV